MVNKVSHARGARGLLEYLQDPDRTYQADSTKLVSMTGRTEGDATEGDEEKKSFWYKKIAEDLEEKSEYEADGQKIEI